MKFGIALFLLFIIGCSSVLINEDKGETLYKNKCSGCHRLYDKNEFSKEEWKIKLPEMSVNAGLTNEEERDILNYLIK
jgi:hypothetical protein